MLSTVWVAFIPYFIEKYVGIKNCNKIDKTEIDNQTYMKNLSANTLITQTNISGFKKRMKGGFDD